jgi:hypothetical protein
LPAAYPRALADNGGWHVLGASRSHGCTRWNLTLLLIVAALGSQVSHLHHQPRIPAEQKMDEARELTTKGSRPGGADLSRAGAGRADQASNATEALRGMLDGACAQAPLAEAANVYSAAAIVPARDRHPVAEVADKGLKLANTRGDADPKAA